jgi:hypothetical protein
MNENDNDLMMAALLGEAPRTPDPGFRFDVLSHVTERARRRASRRRAFRTVAAFTFAGLVFPAAEAVGIGWEQAQPLLIVGLIVVAAYVMATATVQGPRAALARSRAVFGGGNRL